MPQIEMPVLSKTNIYVARRSSEGRKGRGRRRIGGIVQVFGPGGAGSPTIWAVGPKSIANYAISFGACVKRIDFGARRVSMVTVFVAVDRAGVFPGICRLAVPAILVRQRNNSRCLSLAAGE
jgi:hypothetical protein